MCSSSSQAFTAGSLRIRQDGFVSHCSRCTNIFYNLIALSILTPTYRDYVLVLFLEFSPAHAAQRRKDIRPKLIWRENGLHRERHRLRQISCGWHNAHP